MDIDIVLARFDSSCRSNNSYEKIPPNNYPIYYGFYGFTFRRLKNLPL